MPKPSARYWTSCERSGPTDDRNSYADNILRWHLETYREEINRLHNDRNSRELL